MNDQLIISEIQHIDSKHLKEEHLFFLDYLITGQLLSICQTSGEYTVRVLPDEDIAGQKLSFDRLLKKWGEIPCSEIDAILDKRNPQNRNRICLPKLSAD